MIDWNDSNSYVLMNPKYSSEDQARFLRLLPEGKSFGPLIWLSTSGSLSQKWVGLSKSAILASAAAVNDYLGACSSDRWIQTLPFFHVGGLGIMARAYLSRSIVEVFRDSPSKKWDAASFFQFLLDRNGTLVSLVPTQLSDLIHLNLKAPPGLKCAIIGGGALSKDLYFEAVALGWPVVITYGMTECASQIAVSPLGSWKGETFPELVMLPHLQGRLIEDRLSFKGSSLFTSYAIFEGEIPKFYDPKVDGWFATDDLGSIERGVLKITGRASLLYKIGGESVDLHQLELLFQQICLKHSIQIESALFAAPEKRLGYEVHLAVEFADPSQIDAAVNLYQKAVLPFERIKKIHVVDRIPKSPLGKVLRKELLHDLI